MAATASLDDPLGDPPADPAGLAAWALSRIAAGAAGDASVDAVIELDCAARDIAPNLGGRFGTGVADGPTASWPAAKETFHLDGISPRRLREDDGDEPWAALLDPARLVRGVGTVTAARRGRDGLVELAIAPHPLFADPADAWLPPGARSLTVGLDPATGFLRSAVLHDELGVLATARINELTFRRLDPPAEAGAVLGRLARTLLEPASLTADVHIEAESHDDLDIVSTPSPRTWTITSGTQTLTLSGDYEPDRTSPAAARLAELLTPARIVSHLAHVAATSPTSVEATVRPLRTFPFSAWAPDEALTCRFTVDPRTGVLLRAEAVADGRTVLACSVQHLA
ncbi:hypothetical protein [Kitasatospora sp. NPDC093558]|uniref:hypothetical protein n=1 Tax=Kitasatospora sp. NPDC093558 TaxID=3155201 RepID=UPI0034452FC2